MDRTIHTGLFSSHAKDIIRGILEYAADNYRGRTYARAHEKSEVEQAPDGEVVLECKNIDTDPYGWRRSIWDKTHGHDDKARQWIALLLKKHVLLHSGFRSDGVWVRTNDDSGAHSVTNLEYEDGSNPTVAEIYYVYDSLLGRKKLERRYSEDLLKKMHGEQNDPVKTELECARRQALADAEAEFEREKKQLQTKRDRLISEYITQREKEYREELAVVKAAYEKKQQEIEEMAKISLMV